MVEAAGVESCFSLLIQKPKFPRCVRTALTGLTFSENCARDLQTLTSVYRLAIEADFVLVAIEFYCTFCYVSQTDVRIMQ